MLDVGLVVAWRRRASPEAVAAAFVDHEHTPPGGVDALGAAEPLRILVRQHDAVANTDVAQLVGGELGRQRRDDRRHRRVPLVAKTAERLHRATLLAPP